MSLITNLNKFKHKCNKTEIHSYNLNITTQKRIEKKKQSEYFLKQKQY